MGEDEECLQHLVEKGLLVSINLRRRPRRRCKCGIMLDSKDVDCETGRWMQLALYHVQ